MKRSIISIVCLSSILIGCGSSSSGSSSNSPLVTAEYTFQFVQLAEEAEGTSTSSTLFDVADQTDGMHTYAKLAQDVTVKRMMKMVTLLRICRLQSVIQEY